MHHRLFYVEPLVGIGRTVIVSMTIGEAQDITKRYPSKKKKMTPHIHYEVMNDQGEYINPGIA